MTLNLLLLPHLSGVVVKRMGEGKARFPVPQGFGYVIPGDGCCGRNAVSRVGTKASALVCLKSPLLDNPFAPLLGCLCAGSSAGHSSLLPALPTLSPKLPGEERSAESGWSRLHSRLPDPK